MAVEIPATTKVLAGDLDGTLIDSIGIFEEIITEMAPLVHKPVPSREMIVKNYHGSLRETIHTVLGGDVEEAVLDELEATFIKHQQRHYDSLDGHFLDDALDLAERAKQAGLRQVVVTNRGHIGRGNASPRYIVENSDLKEHIEHIICREETEHTKPDPRILAPYLKEHGLEGREVTVIGDQFVDAKLALGLGATAILIERSGQAIPHLESLGAEWEEHVHIVSSLHDVRIAVK